MVTKEELSDRLNELLKIEVDFSKMTKADLKALINVFSDPSAIIELGIKQIRDKAKKEILEKRLGDILDLPKKGGGPLGLGILPTILNRDKRFGKKHQKVEQT